MTTPISDEALARAKAIVAELQAGHPSYGDRDYDALLGWEREVVSIWTLNLQSCLALYVPGLIARLEAVA